MGRGIAQVCLHAGLSVSLCDTNIDIATDGSRRVAEQLAKLAAKGKLSEPARAAQQAALHPTSPQEGVPQADLVVEAVSENPDIKNAVFLALSRLVKRRTIIVSNTSSISISKLASLVSEPESVAGMHFMNPVPLMNLVEVVQGVQTSEETLRIVTDFARRLGKTVVLSQDRPGFIVNRVLIPMLNEACFALQEGVSGIEDIDAAIKLGLNHPMGPLRLCDLIGLDTVLAIAEVLHRDFGDSKYRAASLLRNLVAAGHLGQKSGRGFYVYENGKPSTAATLPGLRN